MDHDALNIGLSDIKSVAERISEMNDLEERKAIAAKVLSFGVPFLDRALDGILPSDLIILGARTGAGKTELASLIAQSNALKGKRVHYFALEADKNEIERRIKYRLVCDQLFKTGLGSGVKNLNYPSWFLAQLAEASPAIELTADVMMKAQLRTLFTVYRGAKFDADELARNCLAIQSQTDLIIIDHLHYIDSDDPNENRGYKTIVKTVRDCALATGKPVVLVAHIRKTDRRSPNPIPSIEDFHGSSDITKIATKCIMLASAYKTGQLAPYLLPTFISPVKYRMGGSARTNYVGVCDFNIKTNAYETDFRLGKISHLTHEFEQCTDADIPHWARGSQ